MRMARRLALIAILAAGCTGPSPATVAPSRLPTAPAPSPIGTTPAETAASSAAAASIDDLLQSMAAAVVDRDRTTYMTFIDTADPVFALEHGRWADDWADRNPVSSYTLDVARLEVDGTNANGELTVDWLMPGGEPRTATFTARFTLATGGTWRYGGEAWVATDAEHFRVLVEPGLEGAVPEIINRLPAVYSAATDELGYEPTQPMQIKLYRDAPALVANTLLSLPDIRGWNEPGEALKLRHEPDVDQSSVIAHEFTHFACFDRAGTERTRMPWWLDEGIASFVGSKFEDGSGTDDRLAQVAEWSASGELAEWTDMAVFEETPQDLWRFVYPQGFALVTYVTEEFGREARNGWLASMATELTIEEATPAAFDVTFDELDTAFRAWLAAR
jgi:hypothetical protein